MWARVMGLLILGGPPAEEAAPPRGLLLYGGGYHEFAANANLWQRSLEHDLGMVIDRVDLAPPPTEESAPSLTAKVLEAEDLGERYDVILAYTQAHEVTLTPAQRDGMLHFIRSGGAWVGLHSAADTFSTDPDYVEMVGARFASHPPLQKFTVQVLAGEHPILEDLADFEVEDEFYRLDAAPLGSKHVLLAGSDPEDGSLRPLAWTRRYGHGRVFYTALGHDRRTFVLEPFRRLVAQAVQWAVQDEQPGDQQVLFNGSDLHGWSMTGPGRFVVEDGVLRSEGGMGLLWYSARPFRDFVLELEFKVQRRQDNAGIFVRFPDMPRSPWDAVLGGYEVQICDAGEDQKNTGSIYDFAGVTRLASREPGEWNQYRITVRDQQYLVELNGEAVCEFTGERGRTGYLGLQNHDDESRVCFRDLRLTEIRGE